MVDFVEKFYLFSFLGFDIIEIPFNGKHNECPQGGDDDDEQGGDEKPAAQLS
jgi:hypothetical protein